MKRWLAFPLTMALVAGVAAQNTPPPPPATPSPTVSAEAQAAREAARQQRDEARKAREAMRAQKRVYVSSMPARAAMFSGGSYLGVVVADVTRERMAELKVREERGVVVESVDGDGPAAKAGIREKDVIVNFNGQNVESVGGLRRMIQETPAGRSVKLGIVRAGTPLTVNATIAKHEMRVEVPEIRVGPMHDIEIPSFHMVQIASRYGVSVEDLTPQLAEFFGVKGGDGVLVRSVERGSPAEAAGIRAGDVITRVNNADIGDANDFRRNLRKATGSVAFGIVRDKREQSVTLRVPEKKKGDETSLLAMPGNRDFQYTWLTVPEDLEFGYGFTTDEIEEVEEAEEELDRLILEQKRKQMEKTLQIVMG